MSNYSPGLFHTNSYLSSGIPWVSSSITIPNSSEDPYVIYLPYVSRNFIIKNDGSNTLRVGYSEDGVKGTINKNYIMVNSGASFEANVRVSRIYLLGNSLGTTASIHVGLSTVSSNELSHNWSGSIFGEGIG